MLSNSEFEIIIRYKEKCTVKTGSYDDLKPRYAMLLQTDLSAEIV